MAVEWNGPGGVQKQHRHPEGFAIALGSLSNRNEVLIKEVRFIAPLDDLESLVNEYEDESEGDSWS